MFAFVPARALGDLKENLVSARSEINLGAIVTFPNESTNLTHVSISLMVPFSNLTYWNP